MVILLSAYRNPEFACFPAGWPDASPSQPRSSPTSRHESIATPPATVTGRYSADPIGGNSNPWGITPRYRERFVVHLDLPAHHAGVAPEPPFPPRVPDQRLPCPAAGVRASFHRCPTAGLTPSNPNRFTETRCPITSSAP